MKNKKISIIVPVYKVEKYLPRCLDSLVNQTMDDIEIICINDGSPDNSINILKAYKEFLITNKGFVETKTTKDIKLPANLKTPSDKDLEEILSGIEKVIDNGKLYELFPLAQRVL